MKIVFLLEEESMKFYLDELLPVILPDGIRFQTVPHRGKDDLRKSIPIKLRGWKEPEEIRFVVVHDQDNNDCRKLKKDLQKICDAIRPNVLVRIPCRELEAWYWGDLDAVSAAFNKDLSSYKKKKKYRNPDEIVNPKEKLKKLIPELQQQSGAKAIGKQAAKRPLNENSSPSFQAFVKGVRKLCEA